MLGDLNDITNKFIGWVDTGVNVAKTYFTSYPTMIMYVIIIFVLSKIFKVKLNLGGSR